MNTVRFLPRSRLASSCFLFAGLVLLFGGTAACKGEPATDGSPSKAVGATAASPSGVVSSAEVPAPELLGVPTAPSGSPASLSVGRSAQVAAATGGSKGANSNSDSVTSKAPERTLLSEAASAARPAVPLSAVPLSAGPLPGGALSAGVGAALAPVASFDAPAAAAPNSADAMAERVDVIYLPIVTFRARFEQKYTAKIAGTTKNSDGVCYIRRPGKVSFSYHSPNKNRVVSDGVTLKIYEAENQQMFTRSVVSTEYPGALAFILGKGLRHSFNFVFNDSAKWEGGPVLVGTPRVANPGYEKVLFYLDEELMKKGDPACVRRVLVIDAQGNRNRFDFIHVEQPQTIPDGEFEFTPPEGTNIIK